MEWIFLMLAIVLEIIGTTLMKVSDGFTKLIPTIGTLVSYGLCFTFFAKALTRIPVSVAYAIWSAVGICIISIIGIAFFQESVNVIKIASILFIIVGVVGLNFSGISH